MVKYWKNNKHWDEIISRLLFIAQKNFDFGKIKYVIFKIKKWWIIWIVEQVGENASTLQLEGVPGASATNERGEGFTNVAETSLNVLDSQTANFDRAEGLTVMENMLQGNSDVQAVFAQNDEMALGAIEAIQGAGLSNQITVVSFDGTEGGIKAVEGGSLAATIAQQPDEMGRLALQAAYDFYAGQEITEKIDSPLELVTKD